MRKWAAVLLMAALAMQLTGCYDAVDLGDQIFAINLALDKGETKALRLTMQYPQITPVGKEGADSGGGNSDLKKDGYLIEQVEGDDLSACLTLMRMVTPRKMDLMQLRGIFISETLANSRVTVQECLSALLSTHNARPTATVFLTRGRAEDVLSAQVPLFGARLSKSQSAQSSQLQEQGVIPASPLNTFYYCFATPGCSAVAVLTAVNGMQYISAPSSQGTQATSYLAGDVPRNTVGTTDYCGCAVFGDEDLMFLDGYETQLLNLMLGKLRELNMEIGGRTVSLYFPRAPRIKVKPLDPDGPRIAIRVPVLCDVPDAAPYTQRLIDDLATLLLKLQQRKMDPVDFAQRARVSALTLEDWGAMDWPALYARAVFDISIA